MLNRKAISPVVTLTFANLERFDLVTLGLKHKISQLRKAESYPTIFSVYRMHYRLVVTYNVSMSSECNYSMMFWYREDLDIFTSIDLCWGAIGELTPGTTRGVSAESSSDIVQAVIEEAIKLVKKRRFTTMKIANPWGNPQLTAAMVQAYEETSTTLLCMVHGNRIAVTSKLPLQLPLRLKHEVKSVDDALTRPVPFGSLSSLEITASLYGTYY